MLIADTAREKFGFNSEPPEGPDSLGRHHRWSAIPTAESAVELVEPATQLGLVIEAAPEDGVPAKIIRELAYKPLPEMV